MEKQLGPWVEAWNHAVGWHGARLTRTWSLDLGWQQESRPTWAAEEKRKESKRKAKEEEERKENK